MRQQCFPFGCSADHSFLLSFDDFPNPCRLKMSAVHDKQNIHIVENNTSGCGHRWPTKLSVQSLSSVLESKYSIWSYNSSRFWFNTVLSCWIRVADSESYLDIMTESYLDINMLDNKKKNFIAKLQENVTRKMRVLWWFHIRACLLAEAEYSYRDARQI